MNKLNETAQKEEILETLIKTMGYEDALVRADGHKFELQSNRRRNHTPTAANEIMLEGEKRNW